MVAHSQTRYNIFSKTLYACPFLFSTNSFPGCAHIFHRIISLVVCAHACCRLLRFIATDPLVILRATTRKRPELPALEGGVDNVAAKRPSTAHLARSVSISSGAFKKEKVAKDVSKKETGGKRVSKKRNIGDGASKVEIGVRTIPSKTKRMQISLSKNQKSKTVVSKTDSADSDVRTHRKKKTGSTKRDTDNGALAADVTLHAETVPTKKRRRVRKPAVQKGTLRNTISVGQATDGPHPDTVPAEVLLYMQPPKWNAMNDSGGHASAQDARTLNIENYLYSETSRKVRAAQRDADTTLPVPTPTTAVSSVPWADTILQEKIANEHVLSKGVNKSSEPQNTPTAKTRPDLGVGDDDVLLHSVVAGTGHDDSTARDEILATPSSDLTVSKIPDRKNLVSDNRLNSSDQSPELGSSFSHAQTNICSPAVSPWSPELRERDPQNHTGTDGIALRCVSESWCVVHKSTCRCLGVSTLK